MDTDKLMEMAERLGKAEMALDLISKRVDASGPGVSVSDAKPSGKSRGKSRGKRDLSKGWAVNQQRAAAEGIIQAMAKPPQVSSASVFGGGVAGGKPGSADLGFEVKDIPNKGYISIGYQALRQVEQAVREGKLPFTLLTSWVNSMSKDPMVVQQDPEGAEMFQQLMSGVGLGGLAQPVQVVVEDLAEAASGN